MSSENILSITKPGDLFPAQMDLCKKRYKELTKQYHPDMNQNDTTEVFHHITQLYVKAISLLQEGRWEKTNYVQYSTTQNTKLEINYLAQIDFELGTCYICKKFIIYYIKEEKRKYYENAKKHWKNLKFANDSMKEKFVDTIPSSRLYYEIKQGGICIAIEKKEEYYSLRYVLQYFDGRIPERQVAWMMSRLLNLACYFQYNGLVLNGLNLDACFIAPSSHSIAILGGWWYATREKEKMIGTTKEIYEIMPPFVKSNKIANYMTDLESIKLIGRKLLGEENSRKLQERKELPVPFREFFIQGASSNALEELKKWEDTLDRSYGARKFIPLRLKEEEIYAPCFKKEQ